MEPQTNGKKQKALVAVVGIIFGGLLGWMGHDEFGAQVDPALEMPLRMQLQAEYAQPILIEDTEVTRSLRSTPALTQLLELHSVPVAQRTEIANFVSFRISKAFLAGKQSAGEMPVGRPVGDGR